MKIVEKLLQAVSEGVKSLYDLDISTEKITWNATRKEFEGDYTIVVFPFTKAAKKSPNIIGDELGAFIQAKVDEVTGFNVIKGFLNLELSNQFWSDFLLGIAGNDQFGVAPKSGDKVMVEFSSPNTNKPLHLGHIRNILLGWATTQILEANGNDVVKVQIVNNRGIAICKSMLAWKLFGNEETPENSGIKGDHLVGKYYVLFESKFKEEYAAWQSSDAGQSIYGEKKKEDQNEEAFFKSYKNTYFNDYSDLGKAAKAMLLKWEANDSETRALWEMMNSWVYQGFDITYEKLGVDFDKLYYESDTYLLGKEYVEKGLKEQIFYKKEDGSVWIDLEDAKMDHKIVLRADGTSVYITQDIGTAELRYQDYGVNKMVYTVADEQNYHFKVLFEIMKRFKRPYAEGLHHLSYGMVDLTTGKMKSREGTVVDADDLVAEVIAEAKSGADERGEILEITEAERAEINRKVGLSALKYFILKVNPQKRMVFDPKESVDLQGNTGPYIQNAYVRIQSIARKAGAYDLEKAKAYDQLNSQEREIIQYLFDYPNKIAEAAVHYDPSIIAKYCYELAKSYHRFYHDFRIIQAESEEAKAFRLLLGERTAYVLHAAMNLLGVEMPERM